MAIAFTLVASAVAAATPAWGSALAGSASNTGCEGNRSQLASSLKTAPEEVQSRLIEPGDPAVVDDLLLAPALTGGDAANISVLSSDRSTQLVGASEEGGRLLHFEISLSAGCNVGFIPLTVSSADEFIFNVGGETGVVVVGTPWAFDSTGHELRTWYEDRDGTLVQFVDATDAVGTVYFDPTYTPYTCANGYYSALSAGQYLDLYSSSVNYGYCVPAGLFNTRNGYLPVWAFETNVANDYGLIPVDSAGGCSFSPDTGWAWDFQVPCKAHDYCYDLRKAGFSGTVSDGECDNDFYWLMEAHCNNRVLAGDCRIIRDTYYGAVSAPGVVTDPDPAAVSVKVQHSLQCADVSGSSALDNAPIVQYPCTGTSNQKFKFVPAPGAPGYFLIKPSHSGKCADVNASTAGITQWGCGAYSQQRFTLQGWSYQNIFTIRSQLHAGSWCWDVPGSSTATVQLSEYYCYETSNQRWILS